MDAQTLYHYIFNFDQYRYHNVRPLQYLTEKIRIYVESVTNKRV